jgi:hypothetical protein
MPKSLCMVQKCELIWILFYFKEVFFFLPKKKISFIQIEKIHRSLQRLLKIEIGESAKTILQHLG